MSHSPNPLYGKRQPHPAQGSGPALLEARPAHAALLPDSAAKTWVEIELTAPEAEASAARTPADVALVVDCSGSMGQGPGSKLAHALEACRYVASRLGGEDRLALVLYGSRVQLAHPLSGDHQLAIKRLESVKTLGMTALADGLYEGIEQLGSDPARARRVFLLSDGLANVGETRVERICEQVERAAAGGIRVSAFGLGAGFSEEMMEGIANAGGGTYRFLESPDEAPAAFAEELNELFAVTLRQAELRINPAQGVTLERWLGLDADSSPVRLGDLAAGAKRTLLVELEFDGSAPGQKQLLELSLSAENADGDPIAEQLETKIKITDSEKLVSGGISHEVLARVAELEAAQAQLEAVALADAGDFAGASTKLYNLASRLGSMAPAAGARSAALQAKSAVLLDQADELGRGKYDATTRKRVSYDSYRTRSGR